MEDNKFHDLHDFMRQVSTEMASEYERIRRRSAEDPGTAGDQGEENWATLLRDWLPPTFEVVTKGRIIGSDGTTSPQVDVMVLKDVYPRKLLDKKLYLAGGVAAAFECKTTLRSAHIGNAVKTAGIIKKICPIRTGNPYDELHSPILYGLLSHSHSWTQPGSLPKSNISTRLVEFDRRHATHPRESLDLICVADLGFWGIAKLTFLKPIAPAPTSSTLEKKNGYAVSAYRDQTEPEPGNVTKDFTPIGGLIAYLSRRLAWENPSLRPLAEYYEKTDMEGPGRGTQRHWSSSIYSNEVRHRVELGQLGGGVWDKWGLGFV